MSATPGKAALVVIDAQRAFVDRDGSLVRTFGIEEAQPGLAALDRLRRFIAGHRSTGPTIFVRSEYRPGQFTNGNLNHGMAYVCVPGNIDCQWAEGLDISPHDIVVTKHDADATTSDAFRMAIAQAIDDGAGRIVVSGFQFTTCVVASAVSTLEMVRERGVRVTVIEALTGSRASSYVPGASSVSRVEATRRHLEGVGVELVSEIEENKVVQAREFPPPGLRLIRDTPIISGSLALASQCLAPLASALSDLRSASSWSLVPWS